ncbi:hypothetical protein Gotri_027427 [Gossypium trilobum]|uniref:Uncharacterized protein n=1 Tax=Gossypium trilobum TaxID=34281 RepID=A0A7J9FTE7_9ROSI|nr:hypothetical protein [Gossypium trilobum]
MNLNITEEEKEEVTKNLIAMNLWRIQTNPLERPSMTKVLEML